MNPLLMIPRLILIWLLCGLFGCERTIQEEKLQGADDTRSVAGHNVVSKVETHGSLIAIYPIPSISSGRLLDLGVFKGFRPKMTIQEAFRHHGPPDIKGKDAYGPFWIYRRPEGEVRISLQEQGSPPFPYSKHWIVSARPLRNRPSDIFSAEILRHVPEKGGEIEVVIVRDDIGAELDISIKDGRISEVRWLQEYKIPEVRQTKPTQEQ